MNEEVKQIYAAIKAMAPVMAYIGNIGLQWGQIDREARRATRNYLAYIKGYHEGARIAASMESAQDK